MCTVIWLLKKNYEVAVTCNNLACLLWHSVKSLDLDSLRSNIAYCSQCCRSGWIRTSLLYVCGRHGEGYLQLKHEDVTEPDLFAVKVNHSGVVARKILQGFLLLVFFVWLGLQQSWNFNTCGVVYFCCEECLDLCSLWSVRRTFVPP